jgi:hypothetical protein
MIRGQIHQSPTRRAAIASAFAGAVVACSLLAILWQGTREAADLLGKDGHKGKARLVPVTPLGATSLVEVQKKTGYSYCSALNLGMFEKSHSYTILDSLEWRSRSERWK